MLFKPNFCCNCGEKIERVDWNLLTSRRFCEVCSIENRRYDLAPRIAVAAGALAVMFGLGSLWSNSGRGEQPAPVKLRSEVTRGDIKESAPSASPDAVSPAQVAESPPANPGSGDTGGREQRSVEPAFYCGALTKKGTPCSRKVKARGMRCFQHEGRPAAPPIN